MPALALNHHNRTFVSVILTALLTGTLDGVAALLSNYKANPAFVFEFIAYGYFGKAALTGGTPMVLWGIFFHYVFAFAFTLLFYLSYPFFKRIFGNKYLIAVEYGIIAWFVMNVIVIPLSKFGPTHFHILPVITGVAILIICVGLPIALIADKQQRGKLPK